MTKEKGFTLVELLITMMIMVVVIALTGPLYNRILMGAKGQTVEDQAYKDLINSMELIRLDIEHSGLGIANNESNMPVTWNEAARTLQLRSVLSNTNQTTMGWALVDCSTLGASIAANYIVNQKQTPGLTTMVLLDTNKNFAGLTTAGSYNCPTVLPPAIPPIMPGVYSAYPYDPTVANGCADGYCTTTTYLPSAANGAPTSKAACAQGTFNLLRRVGNAGVGGNPVINCVADFRVRFDIDTDNSGIINVGESELSVVPTPGTAGMLMSTLKNMEFILLVQVGQRDETLNTNPNTTVSGTNLSAAGVTNANNYRWKVLKISGKPMSW